MTHDIVVVLPSDKRTSLMIGEAMEWCNDTFGPGHEPDSIWQNISFVFHFNNQDSALVFKLAWL